ncbi:hypothetical protein ACI79D_14685 [Geodermatophilus sp. SYSU D00708]
MPIWTVELTGEQDERIEADVLATDGGALVAFSGEGLMVRAWAPGHWRTVRQFAGRDAHPAGQAERSNVLTALPRR